MSLLLPSASFMVPQSLDKRIIAATHRSSCTIYSRPLQLVVKCNEIWPQTDEFLCPLKKGQLSRSFDCRRRGRLKHADNDA